MPASAVPAKLSKVTVHGATVASLLYAVTTGGVPCDGIVFGDTVTTTAVHIRDDDDPATVTESRAAISSALCCASSCSFYDTAGQLDEPRLQGLLQRQPHGPPLLGWLSYRPLLPSSFASQPSASSSSSTAAGITAAAGAVGGSVTSGGAVLRPSMREAAVTQALLRRELNRQGELVASSGGAGGAPISQQAVLLVLVGGGVDHAGATLSWQIRCFQARQSSGTGEVLLEPVEMQTLNLGGHTGHAAYTELHAAASAAPLPLLPPSGIPRRSSQHSLSSGSGGSFLASSPPSTSVSGGAGGAAVAASPPRLGGAGEGSGAGGSDAAAAAMAALAAGARAQVGGVKAHCESMLASLNEVCKAAVGGAAELAALRRRRDELLAAAVAARSR